MAGVFKDSNLLKTQRVGTFHLLDDEGVLPFVFGLRCLQHLQEYKTLDFLR